MTRRNEWEEYFDGHAPVYIQNSFTKNTVKEVDFLLEELKLPPGSRILDLGCGTGRHSVELAKRGYQITGVDISSGMLAEAKKAAKKAGVEVEWIEADCCDFDLGMRFGLIFFPFNSIAHLQDLESIESCFACVKNHLRTEGRFIIETFQPDLRILTRDPEKRYPVTEYPDPDGKGTVIITENNVYDSATQVNRIKWYYRLKGETSERVELLNMRIFYPQELDALFHYNGFLIEEKFGHYDERPFTSAAPKQLVVSKIARGSGS